MLRSDTVSRVAGWVFTATVTVVSLVWQPIAQELSATYLAVPHTMPGWGRSWCAEPSFGCLASL